MDNDFSNPPQGVRAPSTTQAYRPPVSSQYMSHDLIQLKTAAIFAGIGVLLFFIGTIVVQSISFIHYTGSYSSSSSTDYSNLLKNIAGIGRIFNWIGAMIISLPLYITGISNDKLDWKVRASMLSAATAIIVTTLIVTMFLSSIPSY